jgi:ATP-binding cassette subfamily F protein 2
MESIDALAKAVNEYEGGLVLVSHDMRLISQVAKEIWICDDKTITKYQGDIMNFKMDMREQLGIDGTGSTKKPKLKGDASVKASDKPKAPKAKPKRQPTLEVISAKPRPVVASIPEEEPAPAPAPVAKPAPEADDATVTTASTATTFTSADSGDQPKSRYIPPHLRKKMQQQG